MSVALVTGSAGLIGSEAVRHFAGLGLDVVGIDNDMRSYFFGADGSTAWSLLRLTSELGDAYLHFDVDIRDREGLSQVFKKYGSDIAVVIHTAGQPSHDWAAKEPYTDFDVNAVGTLNVLENARQHAIEAPFIHCSTNKVYGDRPNRLPLVEWETRYEIEPGHPYEQGITEDMSIDDSMHSVFGVSKVAADVMVQEYGRYFGMRTATFRGGTLTGPAHSAAELHGFLAYLMRCVMEGRTYNLYGYKGKMVRDAIHSHDVLTAFEAFFREPRSGEVYNLGGGRFSNTSHIEAFRIAEEISGRPATINYVEQNRLGDHQWYISSMAKFSDHYPEWSMTYDVPAILREIHDANVDKWVHAYVIDAGKRNVLGVQVNVIDYASATDQVLAAAREGRPFALTALAVHGVMTGATDRAHAGRLNSFDVVTPDGQPVRWALNLLYAARLADRVYGPTLTMAVLMRCADEALPVYLYGSTDATLERLIAALGSAVPNLKIAGAEASKFRDALPGEDARIAERIATSGARVVLVGLGCPRQEVFTYAMRPLLNMPLLAVGAAFDYHAGQLRRPPSWMQRYGLEWLWRLGLEPRRLWRRYLLLNPAYLARLAAQKTGLWRPNPAEPAPPRPATFAV